MHFLFIIAKNDILRIARLTTVDMVYGLY